MALMHNRDGALVPPLDGLSSALASADGGGSSDMAQFLLRRLACNRVEFVANGRKADSVSDM
jgi:hypothetical protein